MVIKKNHLLPSSKEITDVDEIDIETIIREKEEKEREGEEAYQKQLKMAVFQKLLLSYFKFFDDLEMLHSNN